MTPTVIRLACAVLDAATARVLACDADGVTIDHPAIEAIMAVAGALETSPGEPEGAALVLSVAAELLAELPPEAGAQMFQDLLRERVRARATV